MLKKTNRNKKLVNNKKKCSKLKDKNEIIILYER